MSTGLQARLAFHTIRALHFQLQLPFNRTNHREPQPTLALMRMQNYMWNMLRFGFRNTLTTYPHRSIHERYSNYEHLMMQRLRYFPSQFSAYTFFFLLARHPADLHFLQPCGCSSRDRTKQQNFVSTIVNSSSIIRHLLQLF